MGLSYRRSNHVSNSMGTWYVDLVSVMNKKEIRYAFNTVIEIALKVRCEDLHHALKHQHDEGEFCPVEYAIGRQTHLLREYMKEQGL
jgi:hypothetical protein